jgi:hypothetical protein
MPHRAARVPASCSAGKFRKRLRGGR